MFDIIVLNYNNNGYIQECLNGINKNTQGDYNLIVVDNFSKDGSREWLIENKPCNHLILNRRNVGIGRARNQAIHAGKADWIIIIDSDMVIDDPNWLDKIYCLTLKKSIGFVHVAVTMKSWDSGIKMYAGSSFAVIRRKCLHEVGMFDPRFIIGEDDDWFARYAFTEWETEYCHDTNILHYQWVTTHGVFGEDKWEKLFENQWKMLREKYTEDHINKTLRAFHLERERKEKEYLNVGIKPEHKDAEQNSDDKNEGTDNSIDKDAE